MARSVLMESALSPAATLSPFFSPSASQGGAPSRKCFAVECGFGSRSREVAAAVNPDHHRFSGPGRPLGSPDVQIEAIFAGVLTALHTARAEHRRIADAGPRFHRHWFTPTQI